MLSVGPATDSGPTDSLCFSGEDMGRRANELPIEQGDPRILKFAAALREIRERAGNPTLALMSANSGVSAASLSKAAAGHELPSWRVTEAYVEACSADTAAWRKDWEKARREVRPREFTNDGSAESLQLSPEERRRASWPRTWERWDRTRLILPSHRAETLLDLRLGLQSLRAYRSLSLRQLAHLVPYSHSTLAAVLSGARPVSAHFLRNYLEACGVASPTELISWFDLLSMASPEHRDDAARLRLTAFAMDGRGSVGSTSWRSSSLPVSAEVARLRKFSLQVRSRRLREWLSGGPSSREKRAMYRRLEKLHRISPVDLALFERGEWDLTLNEVNRLVSEAKRLGYTDIDPLVESVFRHPA